LTGYKRWSERPPLVKSELHLVIVGSKLDHSGRVRAHKSVFDLLLGFCYLSIQSGEEQAHGLFAFNGNVKVEGEAGPTRGVLESIKSAR